MTTLFTVQAGDTLLKIAQAKLGNGNLWREIENLNRTSPNTNTLQVGQQLLLPTIYTVQAGDTLIKIAQTELGNGNLWPEIKNLDGTSPNPNKLQVGQQLLLPVSSVPRNVIYYSSKANPIPLAGIAKLPYSDVIVAFLDPSVTSGTTLVGFGGAFGNDLKSNIQMLQTAGKNVLISFGGEVNAPGITLTTQSYNSWSENVSGLVSQIVMFVNTYGFNGVDIDYEDSVGFQGSTYNGVTFLVELTQQLAQRLPGKIITHAPQTHYWDPNWYHVPYTQIWQQVGSQITWINSQFYNNRDYDSTPKLKVQLYGNIVATTGPQKLMAGALLPGQSGGSDPGAVAPGGQHCYRPAEGYVSIAIWRCHGMGICIR